MPDELERLRVALRVLAAVTEFHKPDDADVQTLQPYAPLLTRPDELACEVIRQMLKARGRISEGIEERTEAASRDGWLDPM